MRYKLQHRYQDSDWMDMYAGSDSLKAAKKLAKKSSEDQICVGMCRVVDAIAGGVVATYTCGERCDDPRVVEVAPRSPMIDVGPLPNGCMLYRKDNGVGGHTYYTDEIGGGVMVWDTSLVGQDSLLTAMVDQSKLRYIEQSKRGK